MALVLVKKQATPFDAKHMLLSVKMIKTQKAMLSSLTFALTSTMRLATKNLLLTLLHVVLEQLTIITIMSNKLRELIIISNF